MNNLFYIVIFRVLKQIRSHAFLLVIAISIFLSYFVVPSAEAGYEVFYIGGVKDVLIIQNGLVGWWLFYQHFYCGYLVFICFEAKFLKTYKRKLVN